MDQTQPDEEIGPSTRVIVSVVRTGGIAGIRRQWRVEPEPEDAPRWVALIDDCPWDAPPQGDPGGDRFVWRITAASPHGPVRMTELPDSGLRGPWRRLVDRVREAAPPRPRRSATEQ